MNRVTSGEKTRRVPTPQDFGVYMAVPKRLILHDSAYELDGGTTCLMGTDETGTPRTITLAQSMFLELNPLSGYIPGRLYLDEELVPIRSGDEQALLAALRSATVDLYSDHPEIPGERITLSP